MSLAFFVLKKILKNAVKDSIRENFREYERFYIIIRIFLTFSDFDFF